MPRTPGNINFITLSAIPDLEIVAGKGVTNTFPLHIHEKYCLGMIVKGEALLQASEELYHLSEGRIYFLNPGLAHQIRPAGDQGFDHIVLCFGAEFLDFYWGSPEANQFRFTTTTADAPEFSRGFMDFYNRVLSHDNDRKNDFTSCISVFFDKLLPFGAFSDPADSGKELERDSVLEVCEMIKSDCRRNMSLDELAACAAMSKFHFCRVFKQTTGLSPYEFQLQARIKLAKVMLLNKEPIADIAAGLGFADQSHFYRFFKRDTGLTPGEFIKMSIEV
ncbi:MAG: AraC family transcriptional regulator [Syntrophomonadaceae bacterium]